MYWTQRETSVRYEIDNISCHRFGSRCEVSSIDLKLYGINRDIFHDPLCEYIICISRSHSWISSKLPMKTRNFSAEIHSIECQ